MPMDKWKLNQNVMKDFEAQVLECKNNGVLQAGETSPEPSPKKRPLSVIGLNAPPKAPKLEELHGTLPLPLPVSTIVETTVLFSGPAAGQVMVVIGEADRVFLVNNTTDAIALPLGTIVAYMGKGSFTMPKGTADKPAELPMNSLAWKFANGDAFIHSAGKRQTLLQVIQEKRKVNTLDAKIWCHKITDKPSETNIAFFETPVTKTVGWYPKSAEKENTEKLDINTIGGVILISKWNTNATEVIWQVRWNQDRGLIPVRPCVCLMKVVKLDASSAIELQPATECK